MLKRLGALLFGASLGACTSLQSHTQRIKIASEPEGADVIYQGQVVGRTPTFINLPRHHHATITLQKRGYPPVTKDLSTSYRWGDSFTANFIWLLYAQPVASLIDLLNQTAWDYNKIGVISLQPGRHVEERFVGPRSIAVAPPQEGYELLSDELGEKLTASVRRRYPGSYVEPFDKTYETFFEYGYDNSDETDAANRDKLYDELGVTHVVESSTADQGDGVLVKASITDIFTDTTIPDFDERYDGAGLKYYHRSFFKRALVDVLGLVPDLLTFDFDSPSSNLAITSGPASTQLTGISNRSNTVLEFLSSFGVRNVHSPKLREGLKGVLRLVPAGNFTYDQFTFQAPSGQANPLAAYTFDWYTFLAGLGGEAGLDTSIGYFYLDVVPCYSINWITGWGNGQDSSNTNSAFSLMSELGWQIFISQRINLRVFGRNTEIPSNAFGNIISDLTGQSAQVTSATRSLAGVSLGYYFSEVRPFVKHILF